MGERYFHLGGNEFAGTFTLSSLAYGPETTLEEALDAGETQWTAAGFWAPSAGEYPRDWATAEFDYSNDSVPCFHTRVDGPGMLILETRLFVTYTDLQLWKHTLRTDHESQLRITIDGQPAAELSAGRHTIDIPPGAHQLELSVITKKPEAIFPSGTAEYRTEIETLQFIPTQPASFAEWLVRHGLPPETPEALDPDGNGLTSSMEWAAGLAPGALTPHLSIEIAGSNLVLTSPRNRSAAISWRIEERLPSAGWNDVTSMFIEDFVSETVWRARQPRPLHPDAVYRLRVGP